MDASLQDLIQKIDLLTVQVSYLSEQAQLAERQRMDRAELVRDITPLANQAFTLAVEQLEEIQEYIDLDDLLRLFKRLLRNGRNFEKILDQMESLADLIDTLGPLADEAFGKVVEITSEMEAKGYFTLARGGANLVDNFIMSFSPEELNRLGEDVAPFASMVKELTQPEVIQFANEILIEVKQEIGKPVDTSYRGLIRQLSDPAVRRGLALTLRVMQVIGSKAAGQV